MQRFLILLILLTIAPGCIFPVSSRYKEEINKYKDPAMIGTATRSDVISEFGIPRYESENSFTYINMPVTRDVMWMIPVIGSCCGGVIEGEHVDLTFIFDDQGILQSFSGW